MFVKELSTKLSLFSVAVIEIYSALIGLRVSAGCKKGGDGLYETRLVTETDD